MIEEKEWDKPSEIRGPVTFTAFVVVNVLRKLNEILDKYLT
jgi:hypothetical protein